MNRDIRDPNILGEKLLEQAPIVRDTYGDTIPLSEIYDYHVRKFDLPSYVGCTLGQETAATYLHELQSREAQGDRYAASTLAAMREGKKLPIDPYGD